MKICFWGNIAGALLGETDGGGELQLALLCKALANAGHEVVVIDYEIQKDFITEDGIKVSKIKGWNKGTRMIRTFTHRLPGLFQALKAQKADVYYCRIRDFRHILAYWAAREVKAKFVLGLASDLDAMNFSMRYKYEHKVNFQGLWSIFSGSLIEIVYPLLLRKSDLVLVQHLGQKKSLEEKGIKSIVLPNLIESSQLPGLPDTLQKDFVYVGWLSKRKGFLDFFEIVKKCSTKTFKIIGPPSGKTGQEFYNKLLTFPNVTLYGKLNHSDVLKEMKNSQALISTSQMEGFPNIFIEAWACGIPVLSLHIDPGDIIKKEKLGMVANGNPDKLIEAIYNNQIPNGFAQKAKNYVMNHHVLNPGKIEQISLLFENLYNK